MYIDPSAVTAYQKTLLLGRRVVYRALESVAEIAGVGTWMSMCEAVAGLVCETEMQDLQPQSGVKF
eukprot:scaffold109_cov252-Pinguiococcus_pyrenoidosus.AAC.61